jgi:hypothetical protein
VSGQLHHVRVDIESVHMLGPEFLKDNAGADAASASDFERQTALHRSTQFFQNPGFKMTLQCSADGVVHQGFFEGI